MFEKSEGISLAEYKQAYRKIKTREKKIGFIVNLAAYVVVNSLLVAINMLYYPQVIWFIFPLIGWGIGLTLHYTFAVRLFGRIMTSEEAKAEKIARNWL